MMTILPLVLKMNHKKKIMKSLIFLMIYNLNQIKPIIQKIKKVNKV